MTRWLGLDLLFIWLVRKFLFLMVRTQVQPDDLKNLNLDPARPVCYVLKNQSLSDYLVVDQQCRALGPPRAADRPGSRTASRAGPDRGPATKPIRVPTGSPRRPRSRKLPPSRIPTAPRAG